MSRNRRPDGTGRFSEQSWSGETIGSVGFGNLVWALLGAACLAVRGESPARHRDEPVGPRTRTDKAALALSGRSATRPSRPRRDDRKYRLYLKEEQRGSRGCFARRMQADFYHGLLAKPRDCKLLGERIQGLQQFVGYRDPAPAPFQESRCTAFARNPNALDIR